MIVPPAQFATAQDFLPRSTQRYSTLAVKFGVKANSTPPPAVQPICVELLKGRVPAAVWRSPNATPPVPLTSTRLR